MRTIVTAAPSSELKRDDLVQRRFRVARLLALVEDGVELVEHVAVLLSCAPASASIHALSSASSSLLGARGAALGEAFERALACR